MNRQLTAYEPPSIQRHRSGAMNKMGAIPALRHEDRIDGLAVADLLEEYGSPLFVYSQRTIEERYRALKEQLALRWPKVTLAWSYKTNYLEGICRIYHNEGAWAEVVSAMEFEKALRNGVAIDRIVYNGPHKTAESLEKALSGGALVNIDNFDELATCEKIADKLNIFPKVGLRVNMSAGTAPRWSRFGFDLDSGQAKDAVRRLMGGGKLTLNGIHCHLGTFLLDANCYGEAAAKLVSFT
ncbi:MAG: diaminopimelate decarboxylase, partial [Proteobacteria bacterium]|nr:diaminopimelate decarboxylase [Pseudomonadota bacterium]